MKNPLADNTVVLDLCMNVIVINSAIFVPWNRYNYDLDIFPQTRWNEREEVC